jgi:hypothetical protein
MDDLVDRERRCGAFRMGAVMGGERLGDFVQPLVELRNGPRVERGKGTDDPRLALGDYQGRMRVMNNGAPTTGSWSLSLSTFGSAIVSPVRSIVRR